jgi:hypothetical protein
VPRVTIVSPSDHDLSFALHEDGTAPSGFRDRSGWGSMARARASAAPGSGVHFAFRYGNCQMNVFGAGVSFMGVVSAGVTSCYGAETLGNKFYVRRET